MDDLFPNLTTAKPGALAAPGRWASLRLTFQGLNRRLEPHRQALRLPIIIDRTANVFKGRSTKIAVEESGCSRSARF
jgi:hypothetical protein